MGNGGEAGADDYVGGLYDWVNEILGK